MTITTRSGKGFALTHNELDGNFTDLDTRLTTAEGEINTLEAGAASLSDGTGNLDVSSIIINSSLTETRPLISESSSDSINAISKFIRQGTSTGAKSALLAHTEFSVAGASGMGTGIWNTVNATDMSAPINVSGMQAEVKAYTDENNYTSEFAIYTYDKSGGAVSFGKKLSVAEDEFNILNTQKVNIAQSIPLQMTPTAYADLPTLTGSATDGYLMYLSTDGAGTNQFKFIFSVGTNWQYVADGTTVAAS